MVQKRLTSTLSVLGIKALPDPWVTGACDAGKDIGASLGERAVAAPVHALTVRCAEEPLGHTDNAAVADGAHAASQLVDRQEVRIVFFGEWGAVNTAPIYSRSARRHRPRRALSSAGGGISGVPLMVATGGDPQAAAH